MGTEFVVNGYIVLDKLKFMVYGHRGLWDSYIRAGFGPIYNEDS